MKGIGSTVGTAGRGEPLRYTKENQTQTRAQPTFQKVEDLFLLGNYHPFTTAAIRYETELRKNPLQPRLKTLIFVNQHSTK